MSEHRAGKIIGAFMKKVGCQVTTQISVFEGTQIDVLGEKNIWRDDPSNIMTIILTASFALWQVYCRIRETSVI